MINELLHVSSLVPERENPGACRIQPYQLPTPPRFGRFAAESSVSSLCSTSLPAAWRINSSWGWPAFLRGPFCDLPLRGGCRRRAPL